MLPEERFYENLEQNGAENNRYLDIRDRSIFVVICLQNTLFIIIKSNI